MMFLRRAPPLRFEPHCRRLQGMKRAIFRFDAQLAPLLPSRFPENPRICCFSGPQSVKHLVEAFGIPHTELRRVDVRGAPVGLDYLVADGDRLNVLGITDEPSAVEPKFVLDGHLGRLNASLRMLGFDCVYERAPADVKLAEISSREHRILLTRDRRLLMRRVVCRGYLVRSQIPASQLAELVNRFSLLAWMRPFCRCILCNGLLLPVEKQKVENRLEPLTRLYYDNFRRCPTCGQVFWPGSHLARMRRVIEDLRQRPKGACLPSLRTGDGQIGDSDAKGGALLGENCRRQ